MPSPSSVLQRPRPRLQKLALVMLDKLQHQTKELIKQRIVSRMCPAATYGLIVKPDGRRIDGVGREEREVSTTDVGDCYYTRSSLVD